MAHLGLRANFASELLVATTVAKYVVSSARSAWCHLESQTQKLGSTAGMRVRLGVIRCDRAEMIE